MVYGNQCWNCPHRPKEKGKEFQKAREFLEKHVDAGYIFECGAVYSPIFLREMNAEVFPGSRCKRMRVNGSEEMILRNLSKHLGSRAFSRENIDGFFRRRTPVRGKSCRDKTIIRLLKRSTPEK